mmetsp:Transcript_1148/g.7484  ORF Transcript_1148/g.7484 Transcript_1148/m.7484 type:complete len:212 (+) Transcript_1148:621-1256(+)
MERIKYHRHVCPGEEPFDHVKIKHLLQKHEVIRDGINHLHLKTTVVRRPQLGNVHVRNIRHAILRHRLGESIDVVRDLFRRRLSILVIELDAPIFLWTTRIVAGTHDQSSIQTAPANDRRCRRGGQDGVLGHHHFFQAIARCQLQDDLGGVLVEPPAIAAEADGLSLHFFSQGIEQGLDPVGQVVAFGKDGRFLTESTGPRFLAFDGLSGQ